MAQKMNAAPEVAALKAQLAACQAELETLRVEGERPQKIQAALYRIAEAASASPGLQDFYAAVHSIVSELMYAGSLFIALYDENSDTVSYPYWVDRAGDPQPDPHRLGDRKSVTAWVIRHGEPLESISDQFESLLAAGEVELFGTPSAGICVPLQHEGKTLGVVLVQSYEAGISYTQEDVEILTFVARHIATALARAQAIESTRQWVAELAIINSVQNALAAQLDFESIVEVVGEKVRTISGADFAFVALYDPASETISFPYWKGPGGIAPPGSLPADSGLTSIVIQTRKPLRLGTWQAMVDHGTVVPPGAPPDLAQSWLGVPILVGDEVLGVIATQDDHREHAYSESDEHLLSTLAATMGVAMENARLFNETQQRNAELSIINSVQQGLANRLDMQAIYELIGDRIRQVFDAQSVMIMLQQDELTQFPYLFERGKRLQQDPVPMISHSGFAPHVLQTRQPLMINRDMKRLAAEYGSDVVGGGEMPRSAIFVPLIVGDKADGVISIQNVDRENAFTENDLRLLTTLANSMGVALENARLFDETQRLLKETKQRNAELAIINSIQQGLAEEMNFQGIVDLVGDRLREVLHSDNVSIIWFDYERQLSVPLYVYDHGQRVQQEPWTPREAGRAFLKNKQPIIWHTTAHADELGLWTLEGDKVALSGMFMPIVASDKVIGSIRLENYEKEYAFDESVTRLVSTIASSMGAVLENARLFDELQTRNREIGEALERERATSRILGVIASSPGDIQPVLDTIAENAARLSGSDDALIAYSQAGYLNVAAHYGDIPMLAVGEGIPLDRKSVAGRSILERRPVQVRDLSGEEGAEFATGQAVAKRYGYRLTFSTPLLREGEAIGCITIRSREARLLTDRQIELVGTFADQAAIAIENVRLFNETTRLLKETEERNAELAIINSVQAGLASKLDMQAIYDLVGDKIQGIFDAQVVTINSFDLEQRLKLYHYSHVEGELYPFTSRPMNSFDEYFLELRAPYLMNENLMEAFRTNFPDLKPVEGDLPKSFLCTPLLRAGNVTGYISLQNLDRENAFSDSDVRLLQTLANSMSVALENARLFAETQQRAAELATINAVSQALVAETELETLMQLTGEQMRRTFNADIVYVALLDPQSDLINFPYAHGETFTPLRLGEGLTSKIIETGQPLLINQDMESRREALGTVQVGKRALSYLGVPIVIGRQAIGVISVQSTQTEGRFSVDDVRLLSTIAANVGTAIQNANLFDEISNQKEYYEMIIAHSPAAIVLLDEEVRVTGWNPAAERLFGYSQAEARGRNIDTLVAKQDEIYAEAVAASERGLREGKVHLISRRTRKDGTLVDVEIMALPVIIDGRQTGWIVSYHDITELQRARQEAVQANQAKSAFLANMSHELRTPLNAIIGFTRIVRRKGEADLPQKQLENLDKVLISAEHLLGLINSVLDISKIEAGRMDVQATTFELPPLIDLVLATTQPLVQEGVVMEARLPPDLPPLRSDQEKIKQILINLLSNAAKFTHQGHIRASARAEGELLHIEIRDTGIGISPQALERVFEEFQQADSSTTREYGGTGLGLAISRRLARLLGGDLTATSQEGSGATFTLSLPFHYRALPVPADEESSQVERDNRPLVLAIDDNPDVHHLLRQNLNEAGYRVVSALSGDEGLRVARALQPLAITLDIMMPLKDGWQVLHELKHDPATRHIPVILLTIVDRKALGFRLGAADYLVKPLDEEALLAALRGLSETEDRPPARRLLVVDDDPNVFDMVRQLLEDAAGKPPYEILAAGDGRAALELIRAGAPDAILLDLMMPVLDGFGVIAVLQKDPLYRDIPVIVLTARSLTPSEREILTQSVARIIKKEGLDETTLLKDIQDVLAPGEGAGR